MITLFNYWHYIVLGIVFLIFIGGVVASFKQPKKLVIPMLISVTLISALLVFFSIMIVDKYTKKVELYKLKNKRLLSTEQIVYSGTVKNVGNHEIGEVILEIKLVNKGNTTGNVKGGNFYKTSGFWDFFGGANELYKPQSITKEFVVAKNLKPGQAEIFRVYFKFPPYFRSVSQFAEVKGR